MTRWLFGRLAQAVLVVFVMTLIIFCGIHAIGNPVDMLVAPDASAAERARVVASLGLDRPLWAQYGHFLHGMLTGDLGLSYIYNQPPLPIIFSRLVATLELAVSSVILSCLIGIPLGLYAGLFPETRLARAFMTLSIIGFSLPTFWIGLVFIMVFAVHLGWLPTQGRGQTVTVLGLHWSFLTLDGLRHLLLPALTLALSSISLVFRLTAAGVQEVSGLDYIKFARAKGLSMPRVVGVHVMKNIMIPITTVIGIDLGSTIAFSVVTESIYSWPGMGKLIIDSIDVLDRPMIIAYLIVIVLLFIVINLVVDIIYTFLDPRVRLGARQ